MSYMYTYHVLVAVIGLKNGEIASEQELFFQVK